MATRKQAFWALGIGLACWMAAANLRGDAFPLARRLATVAALTNTPILVTVTFTNASTNALRGFFFGEQLPSALTVTPLSLTINGGAITNYVVENGQDGDVYPGCTPWRWVLETPTNFTKANALPP